MREFAIGDKSVAVFSSAFGKLAKELNIPTALISWAKSAAWTE